MSLNDNVNNDKDQINLNIQIEAPDNVKATVKKVTTIPKREKTKATKSRKNIKPLIDYNPALNKFLSEKDIQSDLDEFANKREKRNRLENLFVILFGLVIVGTLTLLAHSYSESTIYGLSIAIILFLLCFMFVAKELTHKIRVSDAKHKQEIMERLFKTVVNLKTQYDLGSLREIVNLRISEKKLQNKIYNRLINITVSFTLFSYFLYMVGQDILKVIAHSNGQSLLMLAYIIIILTYVVLNIMNNFINYDKEMIKLLALRDILISADSEKNSSLFKTTE